VNRDQLPLGRYVRPRADDARLARQWARIDQRVAGPVWTRRLLPRIAAVVVFAIVVLVVSIRKPTPVTNTVVDGVVLETAEAQEQTLTLPDGSQIALEGSSRVRLARVAANDVLLEVERGALRLSVTHVERRSFLVVADPVTVRVVGTRFRVARSTTGVVGTVTVAVAEGRVAVGRGSATDAMISGGETWSATFGGPTAPAIVTAAPSVSAPVPVPIKKTLGPKRKLPESFHSLFREGNYAGAFAEVDSDEFTVLVAGLGAADLLELAITARLSGHPRRAALALDRLRNGFRDDSRAGIAALDLGRLRLDELSDPRGALDALDDAIALPLSAALKEDAEARRVQALDKLDDVDACVAARDEYLLRHPNGVHTTTVARRCKSP